MFKSRVRILAALASGPPDDIITMDRMKLALWGADDEPEEAMNLMRVHMTAIRQALRLANVPLSIKSSYGVGWYLREERNETAIA